VAEAPFVWSGGVHVSGTSIQCDALRVGRTTFLSHAGVTLGRDPSGGKVLCTARTEHLRGALGGSRLAVLPTPYCRPFSLGRARVELLPSGHAPGGAQLLVDLGGTRAGGPVIYAGAVNPSQPGALAEPAQVRACRAMALDAPLAPLLCPLPPRREVEEALVRAVCQAVGDGVAPVILVPLFAAATEVVYLFQRRGQALRVHPRIAALTKAYAIAGVPLGPAPARFRGTPAKGEAVVWPIEARSASGITRLRAARLFYAGAEALASGAAERLRVDQAFPLSDHADLPSLIAHAQAAEARDLYFTRGLTDRVAQAFARKKVRVHPLGPPEQMALSFTSH
jgi:hypothetical protein